jgi:hypothetical protein|tara:strand:+ start:784 stop:1134 length:351 start_codon:yes stop_codon:yes gene_type:complete
MSNACFSTDNIPGRNCKDAIRGQYQIPSGGPWVDIGPGKDIFKVTYFKYAAKIAYRVDYENEEEILKWHCTCPDFKFNDRTTSKTCCKHVQAVIDKISGTVRAGGNYENFLVEHIH